MPSLIVAGHPPRTQSPAILEFLEELQPDPPLLPRDRHGRKRLRFLAGMLAGDTHPLVTPRVRNDLSTVVGAVAVLHSEFDAARVARRD